MVFYIRIDSIKYTFKEFIDSKIPIDSFDILGKTALMKSVMYNQYNMVYKLLKLGANVNIKNYWDSSVLHLFNTDKTDKKIFDLLISNGANVNIRDSYNKTPLFKNIFLDFKHVEYLLINCTDPNILCNDVSCLEKCLTNGGNYDTSINVKDMKMVKKYFHLFVKHGANINIKYENSDTLFHCVTNDNVKNFLYDQGFNVHFLDTNLLTDYIIESEKHILSNLLYSVGINRDVSGEIVGYII